MARLATSVVLAVALLVQEASACTLIAVGRKATVDGSVIVAHTDDAGGSISDLRVVRVPAMDHPPGSMRPVYRFTDSYPRLVANERGPGYGPQEGQAPFKPLGYIPQVPHTYAYFDAEYGMVNEKQLSIAESTTSARLSGFPIGEKGGNQLFFIDELSKLALERCDSARCAIRTMGDAATQYGFYAAGSTWDSPGYGNAAETLAIGDKYGEAWIFTVMAGPNNASAVWVGQRVPDDHVAVVANGFLHREIDLDDPDNFMASDNIHTAAIEAGFWDPNSGQPFDFTAAYAFQGNRSVASGALSLGRRVWRVYDILAPSQKMDPYAGWFAKVKTYPFSAKVDKPVALQTIFDILGDTFEGTEFDLSKGMGAGPFHYPLRFGGGTGGGGWERAIATYRTLWSFAIQSRPDMPDEVGGIAWYGPDTPIGAVWLPIYASATKLPDCLTKWGKMSEFSTSSLWWAFHFVNDWVARKYSVMRGDLDSARKKAQEESLKLAAKWDKEALDICSKDDCDEDESAQVRDLLASKSASWAESVRERWWELAWRLVAQYQSGLNVTSESREGTKTTPFPQEWLEKTEWVDYPPTNHYRPPPGADHEWADVVKKRENAARAQLVAQCAAHPSGWITMGNAVSFLVGLVVAACVQVLWSTRSRRQGYEPL